jgi:hypothetical protein
MITPTKTLSAATDFEVGVVPVASVLEATLVIVIDHCLEQAVTVVLPEDFAHDSAQAAM